MLRAIRRAGIALAMTVGLLGGISGTAQAAVVNPVTPQSLCGLGYTLLDQDPIRHSGTGARLGTVYLMYNPFLGYACTATIKSAYVGVLTRTQVYVGGALDDANKLYAAGPTLSYVRGNCTIWGGFMADLSGTIHLHDRANPAIGGIGTCF